MPETLTELMLHWILRLKPVVKGGRAREARGEGGKRENFPINPVAVTSPEIRVPGKPSRLPTPAHIQVPHCETPSGRHTKAHKGLLHAPLRNLRTGAPGRPHQDAGHNAWWLAK